MVNDVSFIGRLTKVFPARQFVTSYGNMAVCKYAIIEGLDEDDTQSVCVMLPLSMKNSELNRMFGNPVKARITMTTRPNKDPDFPSFNILQCWMMKPYVVPKQQHVPLSERNVGPINPVSHPVDKDGYAWPYPEM